MTQRELHPQSYPTPSQAGPAKTRAEVNGELTKARRTGDLLAIGESGLTSYELDPQAYPPRPVAPAKSRVQVRGELAEAVRNGDLLAPGEAGLTEREEHHGTRAVSMANR